MLSVEERRELRDTVSGFSRDRALAICIGEILDLLNDLDLFANALTLAAREAGSLSAEESHFILLHWLHRAAIGMGRHEEAKEIRDHYLPPGEEFLQE